MCAPGPSARVAARGAPAPGLLALLFLLLMTAPTGRAGRSIRILLSGARSRRSAGPRGEPGSPGKKRRCLARAENLLTLVARVAGDGGGRLTVVAPSGPAGDNVRSARVPLHIALPAPPPAPVAGCRHPRRGPTDQPPFYREHPGEGGDA